MYEGGPDQLPKGPTSNYHQIGGKRFQHMNLYGVGSYHSACKAVILGLKYQWLQNGYLKKTLASEQATECKSKRKVEDNHIYNELYFSSQDKIIKN